MTVTSPPDQIEMVDVTMAVAINMALCEAMELDSSVVLLGEDIADPVGGVQKVTAGLSDRFGLSRVRDTPISEVAIMGAAVGAAMAGLRPVAEIMIMDFLSLAFDQLVNHGAQLHYLSGGQVSVPVTVRTSVAARFQAGATHSQSLEAWLMHSPGIKVAMPGTPFDAKGLLTTCIFDDDPCVFIENASLYRTSGPVNVESYSVPLGRADVKRVGTDVSLITYGSTLADCLEAAERLGSMDISAEVVDLRWLVPLDVPTVLASVGKTRRAVIVHAARRFCGPGAEIAASIAEELGGLGTSVVRIGAPAVPVPAAAELERQCFPTSEAIVGAVQSTLE